MLQIIDHWVGLITEEWDVLVVDRNASHFIRSLVYHVIGLSRKEDKHQTGNLSLSKKLRNVKLDSAAKRNFQKIANLALSYNLMKGG